MSIKYQDIVAERKIVAEECQKEGIPYQEVDPENDPWKIWPDGIIPAEGSRPEIRLRTPLEGLAWMREMAELRKKLAPFHLDKSFFKLLMEERDEW